MLTTTAFMVALAQATSVAAPVYDVDPKTDGTLTLTTFLVLGIFEAFVKPSLQGGLACDPIKNGSHCDPQDLNALDRTVVGNNSKAWRLTSNTLALSSFSLVFAASFLDPIINHAATQWTDGLTDITVIAEATAMATLAATLLKLTVRRPRPTQYRSRKSFDSIEHQLSFPSGHATATAAATTSFAMTFTLRHPKSPWRWLVWGGATGITALTGYARVGGGRHFYTDVLAGMAIGAAAGIAVPWLHRRQSSLGVAPLVSPGGGGGLSVSGVF